MPVDAIYVGRPTKWGNPYRVGQDGTPEEVVEKYRCLLESSGMGSLAKQQLGGSDLACWCPLAQPCHADVLLAFSNESFPDIWEFTPGKCPG